MSSTAKGGLDDPIRWKQSLGLLVEVGEYTCAIVCYIPVLRILEETYIIQTTKLPELWAGPSSTLQSTVHPQHYHNISV